MLFHKSFFLGWKVEEVEEEEEAINENEPKNKLK